MGKYNGQEKSPLLDLFVLLFLCVIVTSCIIMHSITLLVFVKSKLFGIKYIFYFICKHNCLKSNKFHVMCLQILLHLAFFLYLSVSIWSPSFYLFIKIWHLLNVLKGRNPPFYPSQVNLLTLSVAPRKASAIFLPTSTSWCTNHPITLDCCKLHQTVSRPSPPPYKRPATLASSVPYHRRHSISFSFSRSCFHACQTAA
jgi:hypothetical protein